MEFSSPMVHALERSLDGFSLRHQAIAHNIANVNTPNYVNQNVSFEQSLVDALADQTAPRGASSDPLDPNTDLASIPGSVEFKLGNMRPMAGASVTDGHNNPLLTWQPHMVKSSEPAQRLDGNRTPVETEVSGMVSNAVKYNAVVAVIQKEFGILKNIAQAK
ncbi:MAG: flagellar basal-body rod protein FlgB [Cyanobacteria bacterium RYN_339]|nr:flagellar basal-body rod protein FlgB [Cyanobacteria bacterium RYN_339]